MLILIIYNLKFYILIDLMMFCCKMFVVRQQIDYNRTSSTNLSHALLDTLWVKSEYPTYKYTKKHVTQDYPGIILHKILRKIYVTLLYIIYNF